MAHVYGRVLCLESAFGARDGTEIPFFRPLLVHDSDPLPLLRTFCSASSRVRMCRKLELVAKPGTPTIVTRGGEEAAVEQRKPLDLVITRVFDAPRQLVFEAWTKAEHVSRWFGPAPLTISRCEMDFRPDGSFRFVMRAPNGEDYPFVATSRCRRRTRRAYRRRRRSRESCTCRTGSSFRSRHPPGRRRSSAPGR